MIDVQIQLIRNDWVFLAQNCRNRSGVRREPGLKHHARFDIFKFRNLLFQIHVQLHRARDRAHRSSARAVFAHCFERRLLQRFVRGQPKIIVRSKIDDLFSRRSPRAFSVRPEARAASAPHLSRANHSAHHSQTASDSASCSVPPYHSCFSIPSAHPISAPPAPLRYPFPLLRYLIPSGYNKKSSLATHFCNFANAPLKSLPAQLARQIVVPDSTAPP